MDVLAAQPWHWWLALPLAALGVLALIAAIVGYLVKVTAPKYPRE